MPSTKTSARAAKAPGRAPSGIDVRNILATLERRGTKAMRDGLPRYGIHAPKAFGVSVAVLRTIAKDAGKNHALALSLWETGWYEARLLATFIADPDRMTAAQMDRWSRDFDNWAVVDTACFHLFDRSSHAWRKVDQWCRRKDEFGRRAGFALLASLALHDQAAPEAEFRRRLRLIEESAHDVRNFVKKAVSWALHAIGARSLALNEASVALARRLAASHEPTERWVGKDALRKLMSPTTEKRLARAGRSSQLSNAPDSSDP